MAGSLSQLGLGGGIKSIQRGVILLSGVSTATATITAVNTSQSILSFLGSSMGGAVTDIAYISLTNSTTITATRPAATNPATVSWQIVEYY